MVLPGSTLSLSACCGPLVAIAGGAPAAGPAAAPADSEEWGYEVIRNWQQVKSAALGPQHKLEGLREVRGLYTALGMASCRQSTV